jgi:hypothetical protein
VLGNEGAGVVEDAAVAARMPSPPISVRQTDRTSSPSRFVRAKSLLYPVPVKLDLRSLYRSISFRRNPFAQLWALAEDAMPVLSASRKGNRHAAKY